MNSRQENDNAHLLPGVISSIEPQKKQKNRYSIFVDGNFLIGISESVLLSSNLEQGTQLEKDQYRKLKSAEQRHKARTYLLDLLSRRDHTRRELQRKASKKQMDKEIINQLLDEFEDKGWIDHDTFTERYIRDKFRINRWGPRKIVSSLRQKGVNHHLAERKTNQYFETINLLDIFKKLVAKKAYKFKRIEDSFKRRKKVFDYLARKGYHSQQILSHLDRLMEDIEP